MAERAPVADVAFLAGGAALLASVFMRWVSRGTGSGLRGHALVDAIVALGRDVPGLSIGRLTILWYLVPAFGAASWIAWGLSGPRSRPSRALAAAALIVSLLTVGAFVGLVGLDRLGWGPKVALAGAITLFLAAWLPSSGTRTGSDAPVDAQELRDGGRQDGSGRLDVDGADRSQVVRLEVRHALEGRRVHVDADRGAGVDVRDGVHRLGR